MNGVNGIPPVSPCLGGCIFDEVRDVEDECFYFEVDGSSQGRQEVVCGRHVWYEEANDDEDQKDRRGQELKCLFHHAPPFMLFCRGGS